MDKGEFMKKIAFVCIHNSCRSQIAEALGKALMGDKYKFYSCGTVVKDQINQDAVRIMKELYRIDMEQTQYSKLVTDIPEVRRGNFHGMRRGLPLYWQRI